MNTLVIRRGFLSATLTSPLIHRVAGIIMVFLIHQEGKHKAQSQLTADDRYTIAALLKQRLSQAEIARQLNRSPSTISRELKRNRQKTGA